MTDTTPEIVSLMKSTPCKSHTDSLSTEPTKDLISSSLTVQGGTVPQVASSETHINLDVKQLTINIVMQNNPTTHFHPHTCENDCKTEAKFDCSQCGVSLCEPCFNQIHKSPVMRRHVQNKIGTTNTKLDQKEEKCIEHQKLSEIYCETCEVIICVMCLLIGDHKGHEAVPIQIKVKGLDVKIKQHIEEVRKQDILMKLLEAQIDERISSQQTEADENKRLINDAYDCIIDRINQHREQHLEQLDLLQQSAFRSLQQRKEAIRTASIQARNSVHFYTVPLASRQDRPPSDLCKIEKKIRESLAVLQSLQNTSQPLTQPHIQTTVLLPKHNISKFLPSLLSPVKPKTFLMSPNLMTNKHLSSSKPRLISQFATSFCPRNIDICSFTGSIYVSHLNDNNVQVLNPITQQIEASYTTNRPTGITVSKNKTIYVTDYEKGEIKTIDSSGFATVIVSAANVFNLVGDENYVLKHPMGITLDEAGNLLVCDDGNNRIQVYTSEGEWIKTFGYQGSGAGQLTHPTDVALGPKGKKQVLYVCDYGNCRIQKWDYETGVYLGQIGTQGMEAGQLQNPWSVRVDREGRIVVGERGGGRRVNWFKEDGEWLAGFDGMGFGECGGMNFAYGIAVNERNELLISDYENQRILKVEFC